METALIPVCTEMVGGEEIQAVNARELHRFLESGKKFADWMALRLREGDFIEGIDYVSFSPIGEKRSGGRRSKEFHLSLDMAKHICMLERNDKGKQARQYFVDCEKKLRQVAAVAASPASELEVLHRMTGVMLEQSRQLSEVKAITDQHTTELRELSAQIDREEGFYTIIAWAKLHGTSVDRATASRLGKKATKLSKEKGYHYFPVKNMVYGTINAYHQDILSIVCSDWMKKKAVA